MRLSKQGPACHAVMLLLTRFILLPQSKSMSDLCVQAPFHLRPGRRPSQGQTEVALHEQGQLGQEKTEFIAKIKEQARWGLQTELKSTPQKLQIIPHCSFKFISDKKIAIPGLKEQIKMPTPPRGGENRMQPSSEFSKNGRSWLDQNAHLVPQISVASASSLRPAPTSIH